MSPNNTNKQTKKNSFKKIYINQKPFANNFHKTSQNLRMLYSALFCKKTEWANNKKEKD